MHNIYNIFRECKEECKACGIEIGYIADISVNYRAKSRWGYCKHVPDEDCFYIQVSDRLVRDSTPVRSLKETLLHEMCHTIEGGMSHKGEWLKAVTKLNNRYGYNIKRTSSSEEKGVKYEEPVRRRSSTPTIKYLFKCERCGLHIERTRKSKFTENPNHYCCGRCGGMFTRIF